MVITRWPAGTSAASVLRNVVLPVLVAPETTMLARSETARRSRAVMSGSAASSSDTVLTPNRRTVRHGPSMAHGWDGDVDA